MQHKGRPAAFLVFYDADDNIRFCGTVTELVEGKFFKNKNSVYNEILKIKKGIIKGKVVWVR